jgi:hypothetical protein
LNIKIKYTTDSEEFENDYLIIAIDSTGIKITNRGQDDIHLDKTDSKIRDHRNHATKQ